MAESDKRLLLGHITGAHGVKGEVRIRTLTQEPDAIGAYGPLQDEAGTRSFRIVSLRTSKEGVVARIDGVASREEAQALKGTALYVARDALPDDAEDDSFYHADLVGLVAVSADGAALGQIVSVQNFGAGDLLELRPATGGETVLVPFTETIVPDIDFEAGWLLMLPPEGLLEE